MSRYFTGKSFEVTESHVKLLRRAYVGWDNCEYGAPAIDCKRPYGNGDVEQDIAEILSESFDDDDNSAEAHEQRLRYRTLHEETQTVLQIVLATGRLEAGMYMRDSEYGVAWRRG